MSLDLIPLGLRRRYTFEERNHACAILASDFPNEFKDIMDCLEAFVLKKSYILEAGGGLSAIPKVIDRFLYRQGWSVKAFDIEIAIDRVPLPIPTHHIDNFKNRVGVEVEWNSKDTSYDRDLNNFRLLHQLNVLSVGVIITRLTELQELFKQLRGRTDASTTHWNKLIPKVDGGGAGGCPLLLVGMGLSCYDPNS
jgi:hypothetical protein